MTLQPHKSDSLNTATHNGSSTALSISTRCESAHNRAEHTAVVLRSSVSSYRQALHYRLRVTAWLDA
eukprot:2486-Heterococcus_DN1.PRE.4